MPVIRCASLAQPAAALWRRHTAVTSDAQQLTGGNRQRGNAARTGQQHHHHTQSSLQPNLRFCAAAWAAMVCEEHAMPACDCHTP